MITMRAKVKVDSVTVTEHSEEVVATPVCAATYGPAGESEDNTFARYTPSGMIRLVITNPDLRGKLRPGAKFYVDFTEIAPE